MNYENIIIAINLHTNSKTEILINSYMYKQQSDIYMHIICKQKLARYHNALFTF